MSIHDGHRERMRQRFKKDGFTGFESHEVLEMLLYYCIPRGNTNEMAHQLINRYKTIGRVLRTSPKELKSFNGIGENAAFFLSLLNEAVRYINVEESKEDEILYNGEKYWEYLTNLFSGMNNEAVYLVCLDAKRMVLGHYLVSEGSAISTNLPTREIVDIALTSNAASVILAHNHPGGFAIPSEEDVEATLHLANVLRSVDVFLIDHVIFSEKDHISMMQSGYIMKGKISQM